jgi:tetratricopeptide (TPR) repeat protein
VLHLDPKLSFGRVNLGTAYKEQGRLEEAIASYDVGITLNPESASAHWNRALALLTLGDYERGFAEYEWRWQREASPPRPFDQPMWDGSDLVGRTILLHAEQGLGDTVMFVR